MTDPFGPEIAPPLAAGERQRLLAEVAPVLRGLRERALAQSDALRRLAGGARVRRQPALRGARSPRNDVPGSLPSYARAAAVRALRAGS